MIKKFLTLSILSALAFAETHNANNDEAKTNETTIVEKASIASDKENNDKSTDVHNGAIQANQSNESSIEKSTAQSEQKPTVSTGRNIDTPADKLFSFVKKEGFYTGVEYVQKGKKFNEVDLYHGIVMNTAGDFISDAKKYLEHNSPNMAENASLINLFYKSTGFMLKSGVTDFNHTLVLFYKVGNFTTARQELAEIYRLIKPTPYNVFVIPYTAEGEGEGIELLSLFSVFAPELIFNSPQLPAPMVSDEMGDRFFVGLLSNYFIYTTNISINDATFIKSKEEGGFNKLSDNVPLNKDIIKYLTDQISLDELKTALKAEQPKENHQESTVEKQKDETTSETKVPKTEESTQSVNEIKTEQGVSTDK